MPDLPLEEAEPVREAFAAAGLALVPLVAPTTPAERRARICAAAQGFVYVVSTVGTTGERDELPPELSDLVVATKADAEVPVAVGFGIGTPDQAAQVGRGRRWRHRRQSPRSRRRRGRVGRMPRRRRSASFLRDSRAALAG